MTKPPLLARALLRLAELLTPATDRLWVDAMRGDLDAAHAEGHALSWAFGCLVAAVRLRGAAWAVWRADRIIDDRFPRRMLFLVMLACGLLGLSVLLMFAGGTNLAAALSTAPILLVGFAVTGTLATLAAAILLCMNFRSLPPRIPRLLPSERRFAYFWGADREKMLALAAAGAPEMTLPRAWLIYYTLMSGFLMLQAGAQLLTASPGHTFETGQNRFLAYYFAVTAVFCALNLLHVIAHLRYAHHAH